MINRITSILKYNNLQNSDSILQEQRDPIKTSDRYNKIDHLDIIEKFNQHGWYIVDYQQLKPQKNERSKYVRWLATYQNIDFQPAGEEAIPQILHQGSHDGTKPFILNYGLFNVSKLNSVVVGEKSFSPVYQKHVGDVPEDFESAMKSVVVEVTESIISTVKMFQSKVLSEAQVSEFVQEASAIRFSPDKYSIPNPELFSIGSTDSLWSLFNQVQKKLTSADSLKVTIKNSGKTRKAKPLNNIEACMCLKKELWNLTLGYLVK